MNDFEHEWQAQKQQRHHRLLRELKGELAVKREAERLLVTVQRQTIAAVVVDSSATETLHNRAALHAARRSSPLVNHRQPQPFLQAEGTTASAPQTT